MVAPVTFTYLGYESQYPAFVSIEWVAQQRVFDNVCFGMPDSVWGFDELYHGGTVKATVCQEVPASAVSGGMWRVRGDFDNYDEVEPTFVAGTGQKPAAVTGQPANASAFAGSTLTLRAKTTGATSQQWQYKSGSSWVSIKGATSSTYAVKATPGLNRRQYRLRISDQLGSVYSRTVTATVWTKARITSQPRSVTVKKNRTATFSAKVAGARGLQWQYKSGKNWVSIKKATSSTYKVTATTKLNGRQYRLVAKNSYGTTTSETVTLRVR